MFNSNVLPSVDARLHRAAATGSGSPSVASPSVMLITIGGKQFGYAWMNPPMTSCATLQRLAHDGLSVCQRLEPDGDMDHFLDHSAVPVALSLAPLFGAQRVVFDFAYPTQATASQIAGKTQADCSP